MGRNSRLTMSGKVNIITATYNKPEYVLDCLESVYNQTYQNWRFKILENSTDNETRDKVWNWKNSKNDPRIELYIENYGKERRARSYVVADWINRCYDHPLDDFQFWISDDDILNRFALEKMVTINMDVVYCTTQVDVLETGEHHLQYHNGDIGKGTGIMPDCLIDGGSILFKTECLKNIEKPYYPNVMSNETSHCDGLFMNKLARVYRFNHINEILLIHRVTPKSTWVNH